jgi:hypothetical protein
MKVRNLFVALCALFVLGAAGCSTAPTEHDSKDAIETFYFYDLPKIDTSDLLLGGFSGLTFERYSKIDGEYDFMSLTDRGPNYEVRKDSSANDLRPFVNPGFTPQFVSFSLNLKKKKLSRVDSMPMKRFDGTPMTGLPNVAFVDETPIEENGHRLSYDKLGVDPEGIARDPADGSYWVCEEYRPSILHFDKNAKLLQRWIPENTATGTGVPQLPKWYARRQQNRGFEGIALDGDNVAAFLQSPLKGDMDVTRILVVDKQTGRPKAEYAYAFEHPQDGMNAADKIGDATNIAAGRFLVIEQNAEIGESAIHSVFEIDVSGATNLLDRKGAELSRASICSDEAALVTEDCVKPVQKKLVADLVNMGLRGYDKIEGLAVIDPKTLALVNDNDFDVLKKSARSALFIVHLTEPLKLR